MKYGLFGGALATLFAFTTPALAVSLTEDFSGGLNGWSAINTSGPAQAGGSAGGSALSVPTSGGPDGTGDAYLRAADNRGSYSHIVFGNGWTGDLSAYNGNLFSIDYIEFTGRGGNILSFGTMRVSGGGLSALVDFIPDPTTSWETASVRFNADSFSVSETDWNTILSDVTEIRLQNESINGVNEVVGFDNATLAPVPLPAGGALLLAALGYTGLRRARKNRA